jgi:hypothetical protein
MKKLILLILVLFPILANSQDLIILRNGEKINCTITKIDSLNVFYDFQKGDRKITSFTEKNEIRAYQLHYKADSSMNPTDLNKVQKDNSVIIDTSVYIKKIYKWNNLITFSKKYGNHATGWSLQYNGFVARNNQKWFIPCVFEFERFTIKQDYFELSNYQSATINYLMAGISPLRKLNDYLYLKLGLQLIFGDEQLKDFYSHESTQTIFGMTPSQGIYFIPKSNFGITCGVGLFEKLLTSEIYQNDFGIKFEIGLKF